MKFHTLIPKSVMIEGLLKDRPAEVVRLYYGPGVIDYADYVNVTEKDLLDYLHQNEVAARDYFAAEKARRPPLHDDVGIEQSDCGYLVYWMDRGKRIEQREFPSLVDAVVCHISAKHGLIARD